MGKQSKHMKHKGIYLCDLRKEFDETKASKALNSDLHVRALGLPPKGEGGRLIFYPTWCAETRTDPAALACVCSQSKATEKSLNAYVKHYSTSMKSVLK